MPSTLDSGHLTQVSSHCTGSGASAFTSLDYGHQLSLQGLGGMREILEDVGELQSKSCFVLLIPRYTARR